MRFYSLHFSFLLASLFAIVIAGQSLAGDTLSAKAQKAYNKKLAFVQAEQKSIVNEALQKQKRFERK